MNKELRHKMPSELFEEEAKEELTALAEEIKIHDIEYYEDNNPLNEKDATIIGIKKTINIITICISYLLNRHLFKIKSIIPFLY
mgnify:CR=1 FL=1